MLKNKLEALLFSSGRKMSVEELSKLAHAKPDEITKAMFELKQDKNSSTMLVNEGEYWKHTVREQYLPLVQKIITETELSKTIMETLAVIAFKYPIKQSDLINIRTNKAYDHLKELQEMGYITRQKHGRTNLIKLSQKFFEYFDLPEEKLKDKFQDFSSIAKAIEDKEQEVKAIRQKQKAMAEEEGKKEEKIKRGIDSLDDYGDKTQEITEDKEKLGNLDIVDEPSEEELEKERERLEELKEKDTQKQEEKKVEERKPKQEQEGVKVDEATEKLIEEKAEKILHPKQEAEEDDNESEKPEEESEEEEPKDLLEASMDEKEEKEKDKPN